MFGNRDNFQKFFAELKKDRTFQNESVDTLVSYIEKISTPDIASIVNNLQRTKQTFFYWSKPDEDCITLGIESLISVRHSGYERTVKTEEEINYWKENRYSNIEQTGLASIPLFMGGMKFSPDREFSKSIWSDFSDSEWFVPKYTLIKRKKETYIAFNFKYKKESLEDLVHEFNTASQYINTISIKTESKNNVEVVETNLHDEKERKDWHLKVDNALKKISEGKFIKIVLSRKVTSRLSTEPDLSLLLADLSLNYPKCYIFAFAEKESIFFGASPEKLAKISDGWIEADALAGSIPRGDTKEEDKILADELLNSKKNLSEQNAVVDFITNSFEGFTEKINYDKKPIIRKLSNIQHLWTPIKAKLKSDKTIFSILKQIHPTPAICGVPWSDALTFIHDTEGYNRGLYAGIIGWFNFENEGEFAVAIRSALLKGSELDAFAGCGIVEGSDPDLEFEETELKLKPILSLFPHEKIYQP